MSLHWTPALAVGVPMIDAQHQELFRRAERFILAVRGGERAEVAPLVVYLSEYAATHFSDEERLMAESGYPELAEHRAAHEAFRKEFKELVMDYERKGPTPLVALTLHNWLADWLRRHVSTADVRLARFLEARRQRGRGQ
jgi:hemerythrin